MSQAGRFVEECRSAPAGPDPANLEPAGVEPAGVEFGLAHRPTLGPVLWRVGRWRAGLGRFGEVTAHAGRLVATTRWLADNEDGFLSVAAAANAGSSRLAS